MNSALQECGFKRQLEKHHLGVHENSPLQPDSLFWQQSTSLFKSSLQVTCETRGLPPTAHPTGRLAEYSWRKHTSMLPPPILELKSLRTPRKSAWSFSRMISSTISLACYMGKEVTVSLNLLCLPSQRWASIGANLPVGEDLFWSDVEDVKVCQVCEAAVPCVQLLTSQGRSFGF